MRTVDPKLMRTLHEVWDDHGCAICGDHPIQLHHLRKRSQGGADSEGNIVGLCGPFSKNAHHLAVEDHRVEIYRTQSGEMVWSERSTGEHGVLQVPQGVGSPPLSGHESGAGLSAPVSDASFAPPSPTGGVPETLDAEPGAATASTPATPAPLAGVAGTPSTPQERYTYLQQLARTASQLTLAMAVTLLKAKETGEWRGLGFESWRDYHGEAGLGLPSGTVSKMLQVAAYYRDAWQRALETGVSIERLYLAAKTADDPAEALSVAESDTPSYALKGRDAAGRQEQEERSLCSECGRPL